MSGKVLCVFGATGMQGGSIVDPALQAGFKVRGVTRKPNEQKAQMLTKKGCDMVQCDMTKASVQEIAQVMQGCYAAFLCTFFWDPDSWGKEYELGKKLVDAAKMAGVKHVLWSCLENVEKITGNRLHVPHFTDKAMVTEYIQDMQLKSRPFQYVTFVSPAFYYQNFKAMGMVKMEGDTCVFTLPEVRWITGCDITQMGHAVIKALKEPERFNNKRIEYFGEHAHPQSFVDTFTRITGKKAKLNMMPHKTYSTLFKGAGEMAEMCQWFTEYTLYGPNGQPFADWSGQRNTPGGLRSWEEFLRNGGWEMTPMKTM